MPTLNRDIQSLNLSSNKINELNEMEFSEKKFRNLQRLYLSSNQLSSIHQSAFYKLTGLVELDLSFNQLITLASPNGNKKNKKIQISKTTINESTKFKQDINKSKLDDVNREDAALETGNELKNSTSFLKHLGHLRQLNLASNKLSRLGAKVFSSQVQLRQLILSR